GHAVTTVEGLSTSDELHPLQQSFHEAHALQCGFCTPGMILSAYQLLKRNPKPTEREIRHAIDGNLCRCTGYQHIIDAVQYAAKRMNGNRKAKKRKSSRVSA
ncbi:MAG TPA: 2Fe-2S iron-sulfur cluster-binding protein, partial [Candidatus Binatia bacterium]|nr:2Fe-2S iron-sulfur cluster-binding protein [Candidatus Binatia bacterium]